MIVYLRLDELLLLQKLTLALMNSCHRALPFIFAMRLGIYQK